MKKKKQNAVSEPSCDTDVKSLIHENSVFFDKLIELIPPKFYLPVDDTDKKWFQGLSKDEKALAKKESRENIKKARRDRLDPEKSSTTTLNLLMQNLEKEKSNNESDDEEEVEVHPIMSGLQEDGEKSATYEELRQRLRRKIEELRGGRNTGGSDKVKRKNEKGVIQQKKRKRDSESDDKKPTLKESKENVEKDVAEAAKELKFSHVKLGSEEEHGKKKKRKLSKMKELEKAKQLEEAKKDPEKGHIITEKHSWKAATDRAAGVKVHDNPKLLNQSLKKEKKRQQKNAEKWKERLETQQKMKAEKQQKRSQNIADRIHKKKMNKIAKREKKLLRPGFEGRKEGYVNEASNEGGSG
ncbi:ribosomal RNA-processing protein 14-C [Ricinus communis]|nr:ribosomal RNA-processing protein 14-C [Ricinus communis]|eukprot:XP_002513804.2 ribosomal RNA-processing protein 14-C [Ricinus communis]